MIRKISQKHIIMMFIVAVMMIIAASAPVHGVTGTGWKTIKSQKYYYYKAGKCYKNCFATINNKKYFFNTKGQLVKGHFNYKSNYYYSSTSSGVVKTTAGFVTYKNNKYYVTDKGKIFVGKSMTLNGKKYYAYYDGRIGTGVFKYSKYYRYADSNGVLQTKKGFFNWNGNRYYLASEAKVKFGTSFKVSGSTYVALSNAKLGKGICKIGSSYYYASPSTYKVKTSKGWITYNGKKYYAASGGKIYTNTFITVSGEKYYASATGAIKTGTFTINGISYKTTSTGRVTSTATNKVLGIDVSYFQYYINWKKVKAAGIKYAIIRCGYRGSTNGKLYQDSYFMSNIKNANAAGIKVGVYFFTEAINAAEGKEEADYCIKLIKKSGVKVTYPIVIDTENLSGARASSSRLSTAKRTEAVKAFCARVKSKGYTPMIYASTSWLNNNLNMSKLSGYYVWVAQYYKKVTYGGTYKCWQYTSSGKVNGISTRVDMDYWYK